VRKLQLIYQQQHFNFSEEKNMPFVYCFSEIVVVFSPIKTKKEDLISLIWMDQTCMRIFFFLQLGGEGGSLHHHLTEICH